MNKLMHLIKYKFDSEYRRKYDNEMKGKRIIAISNAFYYGK